MASLKTRETARLPALLEVNVKPKLLTYFYENSTMLTPQSDRKPFVMIGPEHDHDVTP